MSEPGTDTPAATPSWPDQGGNVVIINGGVGLPLITIAGDNPIVFPDFSVGPPPVVTLGGWAGPPPGPPTGTGLVGPSGPAPGPTEPPTNGEPETRAEAAPKRRRKAE